jgi:phospholipid/cholesterol/gamma-HCH transport system substrate-binding protein
LKFTFTKEIKIAVLTIVSGTMLYTGFNFLKGTDTFSRINYYSVYYQNVDGLVAGNPVYVNGFSVGQVKDLELTSDNRVKVLLQVASDVILSDSTVAKLLNGSLLGGKSIVLVQKKGNKILTDGDSIASFVEPGISDVLLNKAEPIMQDFDKTLTSVNKILNDENQKKIAQLLINLEAITKNTNELVLANRASIASTTANLSTLTNSLIETEKQFKPILSNLNSFSDSLKDARLKATVAQANKTMADLDETITKINKGNGSIGKLINEDSLYVHLDKTIKDLDKVFLDMKERPSRYIHFSVFGKKDK